MLFAAGGLGFCAIVVRLLWLSENPWDDDQGAFLITAQEIHDSGGIGWLWSVLWSGEFQEANRHPLYLALLALWPTVVGGRSLSVALGAVTLAALTCGVSRRCGTLAGGIFCVLLGTNAAFCVFSTRIVCEILLVLLCGLAWLAHVPPADHPSASTLTPPRCLCGGALLGLAWLTKGTGLPLFAGYLAWIVLESVFQSTDRPRSGATDVSVRRLRVQGLVPALSCAVAAFVVVGLPLLVRNSVRFGSPFHNLNSLLLFADRYEDLPEMVERGWTTSDAARAWLATHSAGDIVRREATGLIWEAYILLRSLGPAPLDDARILFGLPLALLALVYLFVIPTAAGRLLAVWGGVSWLLFAWYVPIAAGERFILPLLAPTLMLGSDAIARWCGAEGAGGRLIRWFPALAAGWTGIWCVWTWLSERFGAGAG